MFIRANKYDTGEYSEVDVIPLPDDVKREHGNKSRKRRKYLTRPEQQNLNEKNSFRWMRLTMQGNFEKGDYYFTLTYREGEIPAPEKVEDAKKDLINFLRKCRERAKKKNKDLKYLWVMEYELDDDGNYLKRVHFHVVMNAVIGRDDIDECWSRGAGKNRKLLGYVTTRKILPSGDSGLEAIGGYFSKGKRWKKGKKMWNCSRNLIRPSKTKNDHKFTRRQLEKMAKMNDLGMEIIQKKYSRYHIASIEFKYNELKGWHMYLKLWRKTADG